MLVRTTAITAALTFAVLLVLLFALPVPDAAGPAEARETTDPASAVRSGDNGVLAIEDVRWFDGERMRGPSTLRIAGGRIVGVADDATAEAAAADTRIDGAGLTALPGLIDAHVHTFADARREALCFGVTTVIDMFTAPANLANMRAQREDDGEQDTAALWSAGMLATVDHGHGTQYGVPMETLSGPGEASAWVRARLAEGSDFIKLVYIPGAQRTPSLDLATATALIEAAHEAGVMAVAHISSLEAARDLLHAGIDGLVHVFADEVVDEAFLREARARGLFVVPTLAVIAMADGRSTGPALIADPELGPRLDDGARGNLRQDFGNDVRGFDLDTALENVRRLHAAGVPILAGSDAPNPGTAHGATLHAELELLVEAGLDPIQALAAATSVPARVFGADGRGVIESGARADLVLVEGDPTREIRATRALRTVLRNGRVVEMSEQAPGDAPLSASRMAGTLTVPERLGSFDGGLDAPNGLVWASTSDAMMGGRSQAAVRHVARGAGGALEVEATVDAAFAYPWAGAYLGAAGEGEWGDISDARAIAFDVRGTPATYRLMLFADGSYGAPPTAEFTVNEGWQRVEIPLERFAGFAASRFTGMAFVTPLAAGRYRFRLDDVRLVR